MSIFLRHSHNVKPERYGSEADVQYSIAKNSEKIYGVDPDSNVLVMPLFWGFPCLDYSGKQNHGTPVGGVAYHSGSLSFDGVNDYISVGAPSELEITGSMSLEFWANFSVGGSSNDFLIDRETKYATDGPSVAGMGLEYSDWRFIKFGIYNGSAMVYQQTPASSIIQGTLQHIVCVYNAVSQTMRIYINGNDASSSSPTVPASQVQPNDNWYLGAHRGDGLDSFFNGLIDEVRISNVALTAEQIALFYARPWDLYKRVGRTYYSISAAPSVYIPQIMIF